MNSTLFSIGHGNKSSEEFLKELLSFDIDYIVDVRTTPYSRWYPQFNQPVLRNFLIEKGLRYVYMGDVLGGMPSATICYTEGRIDYQKMSRQDTFINGLERLLVAQKKHVRLAVMCSESEPELCHRSKLIGQELLKHNVIMHHIVGESKAISQVDVINRVTKGLGTINLFGEEETLMSRKVYL